VQTDKRNITERDGRGEGHLPHVGDKDRDTYRDFNYLKIDRVPHIIGVHYDKDFYS
jgi:hypothetical protein